ncbi:hypothetical protein [Marinobacter bohaiensis]|uniref:hypothetical protein n=1 Tax=Marinobacter bohaiensis TaxID=2201898 RepID=UPI0013A6A52B|nr:hypothetical protein [Marinobacter bohaiensis]
MPELENFILPDEVKEFIIRNTDFGSEDIIVQEDEKGTLVCGNYIIPIYALDASYDSSEDVEVIDEEQSVLGVLCPVQGITGDISSMTESRVLSWIFENIKLGLNFEIGDTYRFSRSYLSLSKDFKDKYFSDYYFSAPIWGGFSHIENLTPFKKQGIPRVQAISGVKIPKDRSLDHLNLALMSSNSFDRFLKYYHQIEMIFDFVFVRKIKKLDDSTLDGYRDIIKSLARKELDILCQILKDYVEDLSGSIEIINGLDVNSHRQLIFEVFQNNDKEGNPLSKKSHAHAWGRVVEFIELGTFSEEKINEIFSNSTDPRDKIINILAYWVYRIRCSIAHNKISEFAFSMGDERFVCEFGEPLIKEVVLQVFRSERFKAILSD